MFWDFKKYAKKHRFFLLLILFAVLFYSAPWLSKLAYKHQFPGMRVLEGDEGNVLIQSVLSLQNGFTILGMLGELRKVKIDA